MLDQVHNTLKSSFLEDQVEELTRRTIATGTGLSLHGLVLSGRALTGALASGAGSWRIVSFSWFSFTVT